MRLTQLQINGFRSLREITIDFCNLTVLIGENDAGKSSVLDVLDICLNGKLPDQDDYYVSVQGERVSKIEIGATFKLEDSDAIAIPFSINGNLKIKKIYSLNGSVEMVYFGEKYDDETLNIDFYGLSASDQKDLIRKLIEDIQDTEISNKNKRIECFNAYCAR